VSACSRSAALATHNSLPFAAARGRACITRFAKQQFAQGASGPLHSGRITISLLPDPVAGMVGVSGCG